MITGFRCSRISLCGERGIRTLDTLASIQTFQACSFDHSDISPLWGKKMPEYKQGHVFIKRIGKVNL